MLNILSHPTISYSKLHFVLEFAYYFKRISRIAFIIAVNIAILLIVFLGYIIARTDSPRVHMGIQQKIHSIYMNDPSTGYTLRPNLSVVMPITQDTAYSVYTDGRGVRVASNINTDQNPPKVIVIGDSQSFGMGVSYGETYPNALSKELNVEVANLGVHGYGTVASLRRLKSFNDLRPDIIILGHYFDHPRRNINKCSPSFSVFTCVTAPHLSKASDGKFVVNEPLDNQSALNQIGSYLDYVTGQGPSYSIWLDYFWSGVRRLRTVLEMAHLIDSYPYKEPIYPTTAEATTRFTLEQFRDLAAEMDAKPLVLFIPDYFGQGVKPVPDYFKKVASELGIPLVDPTEEILDVQVNHPEHLSVHGDGHLQGTPNRLIASLLAAKIRELRLLNSQ